MRRFFVGILVILPFLVAAADDPAKGHYESALFFLQNQKYQQALDDLNFIAKSFPQSPLADDALLQLGMYYFQQQNQLDQALKYFQQIKDDYTNSNSAPAAYYYIGEIYLARRNASDLDEAFANFERVTRVFPSSSWVDKSLVGAGTALKWRGEFDKAYEEFSKVKVRFADSPLAPEAQFEMGICALYSDHYLEASVDFQQVIDRYPDSDFAKQAREYNTLIYRLFIVPPADKSLYLPDSTFTGVLSDLDDPSSLAIDSKQNLYLVDKGKKTISVFDPKGKYTNTVAANVPYSIFVDDRDRLFVANENTVSTPGSQPVAFTLVRTGKTEAEPLQEIRSVAVNEFGDYFVVSNKAPGVLVYDHKGAAVSELAVLAKSEKEYYKVLTNSRNQIYALDKQRKQLTLFAADGKMIVTIGPTGKGFEFDRIEDFAIDRSNDIYLLTKNPRGVLIFDPSGNFLKFIGSEDKTALSFEDAKLITVGPSGAIYVLDKDSKRILKIG